MHDCLVAFGSNQGDSMEILKQTIDRIDESDQIQITAHSRPLRTAAVGGPHDQNLYVNAAIRLETSLSPDDLHARLVQLESELGRVRRERWGSRKIDLDLLLYGQTEWVTEHLIVPHPRMSFRRFVLEPAIEIAAEMLHVPSQRTLDELVNHLNLRDDLILLVGAEKEVSEIALAVHETVSQSPRSPNASNWRFNAVSKIDDFRELRSSAKLVCFLNPWELKSKKTESNDELSDLMAMAASFAGPTLGLPIDRQPSTTEIVAAMEAMEPLRNKSE